MAKPLNLLEMARLELLQKNVLFGSLSMKLAIIEDKCKTAWTDGKQIGFNAVWVASLTSGQRVGLLAHEVLHCMFCHFSRRGERKRRLWNYATDYIINAILKQQGFELPPKGLMKPEWASLSSEEAYANLENEKKEEEKQQPQKGEDKGESEEDTSPNEGESEAEPEGEREDAEDSDDAEGEDSEDSDESDESEGDAEGEGEGEGEGDETAEGEGDTENSGGTEDSEEEGDTEPAPGNYDDEDTFGEVRDGAADEAEAAALEDDWKVAVSQALQQFPKIGNSLGNGITNMLKNDRRCELRWEDILADFVNATNNTDVNWQRPNRRASGDFVIPSMYNKTIRNFVVCIDTSGSVNDVQLAAFATEMTEIIRTFGITITVIHIDMAVRKVEEFTDRDLPVEFQAVGRGGTSLGHAFKYIEDEAIDCEGVIFFTDMENSNWGEEPDYPVLWLRSTGPHGWGSGYTPAFGEVVQMMDTYK